MHKKTFSELIKEKIKGNFSSLEITKYFLDRIKKFNKKINSFITICEETAIKQAKYIDKNYNKKDIKKLYGIPFAHKDIYCTKGIKTTCGSKMLSNFIPPYNSTVHKLLNKAGFILLGKTNMDEFAMGSSNETSFYGPVKNPWNLDYVPGGSSGGSAASVASRIIPISTGSDTGGSIRQPSSFCGVTGIKPTYGLISRFGMIAFASSLDQGGIIAQSAEDCAILLEIISKFDSKDSTSIKIKKNQYTKEINNKINNLKIGMPEEFWNNKLQTKIQKIFENAISIFKQSGVSLKKIKLPNINASIPAYYTIASAECSSNLSKYDGIRYGYKKKNIKNINDLYEGSRNEGFGNEVKRRIIIGTYILSYENYNSYYIKAQKVRRIISNDYKKAFEKVDVIISPTTDNTAFKLKEKINDTINMYLNDIYTCSVNLAGLPAISIPVGYINNMPIGLQIIGNYFDEKKILNLANQFQLLTNWHKKIPKNFN